MTPMVHPLTRTPTPPAYPVGWYCVAFSKDLPPGRHRDVTFMGDDLVLYRTASGVPRLIHAYCPHLGAHLGDGSVERERFRCPFHGLEFDIEGRCVTAPYGRPPQRSRLTMVDILEFQGLILARHGELSWVPIPPSGAWPALATHTWRFRGHPQEVTENSVDLAHLSVLHRFADVQVLEDVAVAGPTLTAAYSIRRRLVALNRGIHTEFRIRVDGLGFSHVHITLPDLGVEISQFILPTPVSGETMDLRLAVTARGPLRSLARRGAVFAVVRELNRDIAIWTRKQYLPRPALSRDDGPIGRYRTWTRQFYPDSPTPASIGDAV